MAKIEPVELEARVNWGDDPKPGQLTSEYGLARSCATWGTVGIILGIIVAAGGAVLEAVELPGRWAAIAGAIVAAASAAMRTLTAQGYIKSRCEVKTAADSRRAWEARAKAATPENSQQ